MNSEYGILSTGEGPVESELYRNLPFESPCLQLLSHDDAS